MALRANFNSDLVAALRVGGTSGYGLAASALDGYLFILGMESLLHNKHLTFSIILTDFAVGIAITVKLYHKSIKNAIPFLYFLKNFYIFPVISLRRPSIILFSSLEIYDWEMPRRSATSF